QYTIPGCNAKIINRSRGNCDQYVTATGIARLPEKSNGEIFGHGGDAKDIAESITYRRSAEHRRPRGQCRYRCDKWRLARAGRSLESDFHARPNRVTGRPTH